MLHWLAWFTAIEGTLILIFFMDRHNSKQFVGKVWVLLSDNSASGHTDNSPNPPTSSVALKSHLKIKIYFWNNHHNFSLYFQRVYDTRAGRFFGLYICFLNILGINDLTLICFRGGLISFLVNDLVTKAESGTHWR